MSTNSQPQQRPELSATHTSTVPSPQHPLCSSTADSAQPALSQHLHQTFQPPYSHPHPTLNPQYPPSHPPSNYPPQLPYLLVQYPHPLQQAVQYPTHHTASHPHYNMVTPFQIRQAYFSLYQLPRPQSFPHPLHYPATQLHSNINCFPQFSTLFRPSHPPLDPTHCPPPHHHPPSHSPSQPPLDPTHTLPPHSLAHQSQYVQSRPPLSHTHDAPTHPPTHYTPPQLPTSHQPPTPYYPPHYLPPIQPPQAAGSTSSVSEETVPTAKIARLEPPVRPHSALSQFQHIITDVGTADSTPLVSQIRATQTTACPTPPNPILTNASVSRQPSPTHTSATPPLQSSTHYQSSKSDQPQATTVQSESLTVQKSTIVEDVLTKYNSRLTEVFSIDLHYFSNRFIELGFVRRKAASDIQSMVGIGSEEKGDKLLDLVIVNCNTSCDRKAWFDKFVGVFSCEAAYKDLATSMAEEFKSCVSHIPSSPSTSHSAQPSADHLELPVKPFIDYVKTFYRESEVERSTSVVKWPPTPSKVYINLACIDRHSVNGRSREYDKVTEAMVRDGNVDAIVNVTKGPIDFSEIGKNISMIERAASDEKNSDIRRLILVEGAPGVGKSTFAWEFCRKWERGKIAQRYQLVLLLRLREERISNAKSLEDLIYHPSKDVRHNVNTELEHNLGINTLIILEGFDELPDTCRNSGSVFMDLIAGKLLPLATVLVTSRPWATQEIRLNHENRIYQHIEILGFTDCQITEYIESTLPQDKVSDLKVYLESHPQIRAGMYIPLNSAIVVAVYEESQASGYAMPTTLTELYTSLTHALLLRFLRGHPEYEADGKSLQTFRDLPQPVNGRFYELCKLAYNGTVGTISALYNFLSKTKTYYCTSPLQLIFSNLPSNFDDLGFMDSVTELYVTWGAVSSHNFLHLTFQEFFAAVHISNMSPAEQAEHFMGRKEGKLKVVLRFLAGLNKMNCFSMEEIANNFFKTPLTHEGSRYQMFCDAAIGIDLVQWLFEAQSDDVIGHVLGQKTIEFNMSSKMLPLDYYSLGYCISHSQCQWLLRLGKNIGEDEVKMLAAGATMKSGTDRKLVGLMGELGWQEQKIHPLSFPAHAFNMIITQWKSIFLLHAISLEVLDDYDKISWCNLSSLQVLELEINGDMKLKLESSLPFPSLQSLTIVINSDIYGVICSCDSIGKHVAAAKTLKELQVCILTDKQFVRPCLIKTYNVEAITSALASNQSLQLQRLELECKCILTASDVENLAEFITKSTTLQCLSLRNCTIHERVEDITLALANNHLLPLERVELEFDCTFPITAIDNLVQFITKSTTLKQFIIGNSTFTAHGLHQLVRTPSKFLKLRNLILIVDGYSEVMDFTQLLDHYQLILGGILITRNSSADTASVLHHSSIVRELHLTNCTIMDDVVADLDRALWHSKTLTRLNLSSNSIDITIIAKLASALTENSKLIELDLSSNSVGHEGAEKLAGALSEHCTLTTLNLSNNKIGNTGAGSLASTLTVNSTLTVLNLSNNDISDAGTEELARALVHNSTLTKLVLSHNSISNFALTECDNIMILDLSSNSISDTGATQLAQTISKMSALNLSHNNISDKGAVALAHALHYNCTLAGLDFTFASEGQSPPNNSNYSAIEALVQTQSSHHHSTLNLLLDLSDNVIHDDGARAIAQALHHNSTLIALNLSNNSITDAGAAALAEGLRYNSTLETLSLSSSNICDVGTVNLAEALRHNCTLVGLDLPNNCVSDAGATALANALCHNSTLKVLDLSSNKISDDGTVNLAQALHHNSALIVLDLSGNDGIGEVGTSQLVHALTENISVTENGGLQLPRKCEEFATQCSEYHRVIAKISYS